MIRGCGRFLGVVSYTASPWLVLYSTGLFQPSDCLILEWLYQWMYSPARLMTSSHVRSSQCPEMHGLDLHTAEEPLGRGVVGAAPLRAHGPDQAVPAHPFQPSRPPVMTTAVTVDHGTLAGPQRGGGPDPASCRAGSAFGDVPAVCATTMPSWQSIIGERYTFPSLALISVMSVSHFSLGRSAVKSRLTRLSGAGVTSPSYEL